MATLIDALVDLSSRDALTGLANRRAFELAVAREVDRVARSGESALLLTLDIDHFKRVNDTWGHAAGDQVIRAVAQALMDSVRPMDLVARVGGEEFAIILPNCAVAIGQTVAERVRQRVQDLGVGRRERQAQEHDHRHRRSDIDDELDQVVPQHRFQAADEGEGDARHR